MEISVLRPGKSWAKRDKLVTLKIENCATELKEGAISLDTSMEWPPECIVT